MVAERGTEKHCKDFWFGQPRWTVMSFHETREAGWDYKFGFGHVEYEKTVE